MNTTLWKKRYPKLLDKEWLCEQLKNGATRKDIAAALGCELKNVRKAMRYHGIGYPLIINNNSRMQELFPKSK